MIVVGHLAPDVAGGRWNRPGIGWGDPVEGQAPIGTTKSPPGVEGSGVRPILTRRGRLSVGDLSAIIPCRFVSRGLVVRISAFGAPKVPWSDMKRSIRSAPHLTYARPSALRVSAAIVFRPVMQAVAEFWSVDEHGNGSGNPWCSGDLPEGHSQFAARVEHAALGVSRAGPDWRRVIGGARLCQKVHRHVSVIHLKSGPLGDRFQ